MARFPYAGMAVKMVRDRRKLFPTLTPPEEAVSRAKSLLPRGLEAVTLNLYDAALHKHINT